MKSGRLSYLLKEGVRSLWVNRLMTLASVGVLMCCMLLVGSAYLFSENVYAALRGMEKQNRVQAFLNQEVSLDRAMEMQTRVLSMSNVSACTLKTKEEALEDLKKSLGDNANLLDSMQGDENPLVHTLNIQIDDLSRYNETVTQIKELSEVNTVNSQQEFAEKLTSIRRVVMLAGFWVILIFILVALFILSNTVRLTMYARRLEIGIMRSVGATNTFIKLPFVVEGVFMGLLSGLLSEAILWYVYRSISSGIESTLSISMLPFQSRALIVLGGFVVMGVLVGSIGSLISMRRYLKKEGSELFA